jgi:elongation factor 1 alpha-like protein
MPPKSGHQRAKNIDYDDDELYSDEEYYEKESGAASDGMTDEDKEQMRICTVKVREALDSSLDVTDAQIQESLWHYYYDVGKTVTYLKSKSRFVFEQECLANRADKSAPKPQTQTPKEKAPSRFDQAAGVAEEKAPTGKQFIAGESTTPVAFSLKRPDGFDVPRAQYTPDALYMYEFPTPTNFFWDTPWGNVPPHRLGVMTAMPPPVGYKGGLLGGSTKLQALAAKRKQKSDAAKASEDTKTDKAVALLDKLNVKDAKPVDAQKPQLTKYPSRKRSQAPEEIPKQEEELKSEPTTKKPVIEFPDLRAQPSMFGATLCGLAEPTATPQNVDTLPTFPLPYTTLEAFRKADPFAGPSPDDVVRQAQARGAKRG